MAGFTSVKLSIESMKQTLLAILLIGLSALSSLAQAQSNATPAIRYVRTDGTNPDPSAATSWATSTTNLQGAIDASNPGDQVWVATGTYKPGGNANINRDLSFAMKDGVTIYGGFAATGNPTLTERNPSSLTSVLSGDIGAVGSKADNSYHVFYNPKGLTATAVLDGFVIRDGNANAYAIDRYGPNRDPFDAGGGMYNYESSPTLIDCRFQDNSTANSGGGMCNVFCNPTLINCSFVGNLARTGGGLTKLHGSATLINCSFVGNSATDDGGGMHNFFGNNPALTNCIFVGNSATRGGGMSSFSCSPTLINCSFLGNTASSQGGGMYIGINSITSLTNCVLFGNGGDNTFYTSNGGSITASYSLLETGVAGFIDGGNNLTAAVSPFLSPTDARLNACSPAINTGDNATNRTNTDLAGNPRLISGRIDMGAYEYQMAPGIIPSAPGVSTATVGVVFSQLFTVSGGTSPYSYSLASGNLPPGLSLTTTGTFSGTPTQAGSFTLTAQATDATGCSGVSGAYVLTVIDAIPTLTAPARLCVKSTGSTNTTVTLPLTMTLSGGTAPFTYSWSYKAPNSTKYKAIDATGTTIGKVSLVPLANTASLKIMGSKGNLNGLQSYFIRLTVADQTGKTTTAETLLDGSCGLGSGARMGSEEQALQVRLFPNPVVDVLQLEVNGLNQPAQVRLYDIQGRTKGHWSMMPQAGQGTLKADVSTLGEGLYIVEVETLDGVLHRQRVLKQR